MRNIQLGLTSGRRDRRAYIFICSLAVLLASGCAWDGTETPTQKAEVRSAAPQDTSGRLEVHEIFRQFESEKMKATVAELPAQF